jgi:sugar lactone lactonase YvrE
MGFSRFTTCLALLIAGAAAYTLPPLLYTLGGTHGYADGTTTDAQLTGPQVMKFDDTTGDLIFNGHSCYRRMLPTGRVNTWVGLNGHWGNTDGITVDARVSTGLFHVTSAGLTYFSNNVYHVISTITTGGTVATICGTSGTAGYVDAAGFSAMLDTPRGLTDYNGDLYLSDGGNFRLRKIRLSDRMVSFVAGSGVQTCTPHAGIGSAATFNKLRALVVDSTGIIFGHDVFCQTVVKVVGATVSVFAGTTNSIGLVDGTGGGALFQSPHAIDIDGSDELFVVNYGGSGTTDGSVRHITQAAVVTTVVFGLTQCMGVAVSANGWLAYPIAYQLHTIAVRGTAPVAPTASPTAPTLGTPDLVVGQVGSNGWQDGSGSVARFNKPFDVAFDGTTSDIVVADLDNFRIRRVALYGRANTFAGSGTLGLSDGLATAATLERAIGVAVDASGVTFVTEFTDNTIRSITAGATVSTIAGTSTVVGTTDADGLAAQFFQPAASVAVGSVLYICDRGNHLIRKMTTAAPYTVTTIAGSQRTNNMAHRNFTDGPIASFAGPYGIAADSAGVLYVADRWNHAIRKIATDNTVSTLAGTGVAGSADSFVGVQASLNFPQGVAVDPNGYVYVADSLNNALRLISPEGVVSTLLSTGLNAPSGVSLNAALGIVHIADSGNHVYRSYAAPPALTASPSAPALPPASMVYGTGTASSGNGIASFATFNAPVSAAADGTDVLVADTGSHKVRRLAAGGRVNTVAGSITGLLEGVTTTARFASPQGVTVAASGDAYVADTGNHRVRSITTGGTVATFAGTTAGYTPGAGLSVAQFDSPRGLSTFGTDVFVADYTNKAVRKVQADSTVSAYAGTGPASASFLDGPAAQATFGNVHSVAASSTGVLYVADSFMAVRKVALDQSVTTIAGTGAAGSVDGNGVAAQFSTPLHMSVDSNDYVFVADSGNNALRLISPAGYVSTLLSTGLTAPAAVLVLSSTVYVVDSGNNRVLSYGVATPAPLTASPLAPTLPAASLTYGTCGTAPGVNSLDGTAGAARLSVPHQMTPDAINGGLLVADYGARLVLRLLPNGRVNTLAGIYGTAGAADGLTISASFNGPTGVTMDGSGTAFVSEYINHLVRRISSGGTVSTWAGAGTSGYVDAVGVAAKFNTPISITFYLTNTYVADHSGARIRKIAADATVTTYAGTSGFAGFVDGPIPHFNAPRGLAFDGSGALYVADSNNNAIRKVLADGSATTLAGGGPAALTDGSGVAAAFDRPYHIDVDAATGYVYVADLLSNAVRLVSPAGLVSTLLVTTGPRGVVLDGASVYVAGNQCVQAFGAATPSPLADPSPPAPPAQSFDAGSCGTAGAADAYAASFSTPTSVAFFGGAGALITDQQNHRVRLLDLATRVTSTYAGSSQGLAHATGVAAQFDTVSSVTTDGASLVFVADTGNNMIRMIDNAVAVSGFSGTGVAGLANGAAGVAQFNGPRGVTLAAAVVYVADTANNCVRAVDNVGAATTLGGSTVSGFVDGPQGTFYAPEGVAVDGSTIYVADTGNHAIRKIVGGLVSTVAGTGESGSADATGVAASFSSPGELAIDSTGHLFVADRGNDKVRAVLLATSVSTTVAAIAGAGARGVALRADGSMLVVQSARHCVRAYGVFSATVTPPPTFTPSASPTATPPPTFTASVRGTASLPLTATRSLSSTGAMATYHVGFALAAEAPARAIRRGDVLSLTATVVVDGAMPATPPQLVVIPAGLVAASLPAACTVNSTGAVACNLTATTTALSIALVAPMSGAPPAVSASLCVAEHSGGAYRNVTAANSTALATVFATRGLAQLSVAGTSPAMNRLTYGSAVTVTGTNLDLLPSRVLIGPAVVDVSVTASLNAATFTVASTPVTEATTSSTVALVTAAASSTLHKTFAAVAATAGNAAVIDVVRSAVTGSSAVPLHRFNFNFSAGAVFLNAEVAATGDSVTIGTAAVTVPSAPAAIVSNSAGTTTLAVFSSHAGGLAAGTATGTALPNAAGAVAATAAGVTAASSGGSWTALLLGATPHLAVQRTESGAVGVLQTAARFNATTVAHHAGANTNYTVTQEYVRPALVATLTLRSSYSATLAVSVASGGLAVQGVAVVAYTDHVSSVGFATRSATAGCTNLQANHSVQCGAATVTASTAAAFLLTVAAPAYFRRDVIVRLHVTAANAQPVEARVRFQRAPAGSVFYDAAAGIAPNGAPGTTAAAATDAPAEQSLSSAAASLGVFSLDGGCAIPKLPVVWLTFLCFVAVLGAHGAHRLATQDASDDDIATFDVSPSAGLMSQHAYVGAFAPCHRRCGPTHAALLLAHVLCLAAAASSMLTSHFELADADPDVATFFAFTAALAAAAVKAAVGAPFTAYRLRDEREANTFRGAAYRPAALQVFDVGRSNQVGFTSGTVVGFDAVGYAGADEGGRDVDDAAPSYDAADKQGAEHRNPEEGVTVVARPYALGGFAACGVAAVAFATVALVNTAPWCGRRIAAFERVLLAAVCLDVLLVQPVYVLFVWLWRWMVSEEDDGRAVHETHPVDGQWRVVGRADPCDDDAAGAVAAAAAVPASAAALPPAAEVVAPRQGADGDVSVDDL